MAINKIKSGSIQDGTVTADDIQDGAITNAKVNACAAIAQSKVSGLTTSISNLCSSISSVNTSIGQQANNIALLGFKMAVNDGLTVFNLVDGVVDEFNDESGTDEAEGSNDLYCGTSDYYTNLTPNVPYSAGFSTTAITEPDTSTAGTNPSFGCGTYGSFTVPTGMTSANIFLFGAGGGSGCTSAGEGGAGGYTTGTLAVSGSQSFKVIVGEGGIGGATQCGSPAPTTLYKKRALGGGGSLANCAVQTGSHPAQGGGFSGILAPSVSISTTTATVNGTPSACTPNVYMVAGGGGGGGYTDVSFSGGAGAGGGLTGQRGGDSSPQTNCASFPGPLYTTAKAPNNSSGGGGDQEQGGQGGDFGGGPGYFLEGGVGDQDADYNVGAGGGGFWGGGGAGYPFPNPGFDIRLGGGGSSYFGNPNVSSGSTEAGAGVNPGGAGTPNFSPTYGSAAEGLQATSPPSRPDASRTGGDGYVLITGCVVGSTTSTTIVSTAFTSTSVATSARIVVFEENVDTPTLNTDIIASISRDGGTTFTNATLSDSGYVTGSSGQRILTGQATISGQPSGQSMRWKLALANNQVKIHGVALQWS